MAKKLRIKLVKSPIGYPEDQKDTVKRLGLRRLNHVVVKEDCPQIRGMIRKVRHLIEVEEIEGGDEG